MTAAGSRPSRTGRVAVNSPGIASDRKILLGANRGYGSAVGMARDLHGSHGPDVPQCGRGGIACQLGPGGLLLVGAMPRRREHRVAVMAKPALVVVADEDTSLQALAGELESRYGA